MNPAGDVWCVIIGSYPFGPFTRAEAEQFAARHGGAHSPLWAAGERDQMSGKLMVDLAMVEARKAA